MNSLKIVQEVSMKIYIRREEGNEFRAPLVPSDVKILVERGFHIYIESSDTRVYKDSEYSEAGAIVTTEKWYNDKYKDFLIVGLKELYNLSYLNHHSHVYFSHSFKGQANSREILNAFKKSNSKLYDFEYFLQNNKRVIAFGTYAGQAGCALGLLQASKLNNCSLSNLEPWSYSEMCSLLKPTELRIAIIGSGRCATGVKKVLNDISQPFVEIGKVGGKPLSTFGQQNATFGEKNATFGQQNATFGGHEFDYTTLTEYDIIYNCILLDESYDKVWFDKNTIFKKPIIIVDISCDYSKPNNPIQLYNKGTTWENPVFHYKNVDIIAIDNLPSLLPKESSDEFSSIFREMLNDQPLWAKTLDIFYKHSMILDKWEV